MDGEVGLPDEQQSMLHRYTKGNTALQLCTRTRRHHRLVRVGRRICTERCDGELTSPRWGVGGVGMRTRSQDQAELSKLKAMWDNDAWRRDDVAKPAIQMLGKPPAAAAASQAHQWDNTSYVYAQHTARPNPLPVMPPAPPPRTHQVGAWRHPASSQCHPASSQRVTKRALSVSPSEL